MPDASEQPSPIRLARPSPQGLSGLFDYTLFVGPSACFHHSQDVIFDPARTSALCLDDTQLALGATEQAIEQAADELLATVRPPVKALRILTSCQSAFVGADFRAAARRIARGHGIVCVHEENNRMTVAGKRDKGVVSATGDPKAFAAGLLDCAAVGGGTGDGRANADGGRAAYAGGDPVQAAAEGRGRLVFVSDALSIDARCELLHACRDLGFSRIQTLGDWNTPTGLARGAQARFALVASADCVPLAREAQARWGLAWEFLPVSYALDEVDAHYRRLSEALDAHVDAAAWRAQAQAAVDRALRAADGRELELDLAGASRPWHLAKALMDYGFRVRRIGCSHADRAHPVAFDADYDALLRAYPSMRQAIAHDEFIHRKSKLVEHGALDAELAGMPQEGACWGYFAVVQCMERIACAMEGRVGGRVAAAGDRGCGGHAATVDGEQAAGGAGGAACNTDGAPAAYSGRSAAKGLFNSLMPFVPDVVGACAAFSEASALVLFNDMNGTLSTFYQRVGVPEKSPMALRSTKNVRELSYVLGRDEDFMAAYRDQIARTMGESQAGGAPVEQTRHDAPAHAGGHAGAGEPPSPPLGTPGMAIGRDPTPPPACAPSLEGAFQLVVLLHGPVSATTGVDTARLARRLEAEVRVPVLAVEGTGSGPYDQGVSDALVAVFRRVRARLGAADAPQPEPQPGTVNLLGIDPLDLPGVPAREAYLQLLRDAAGGARVLSRWGAGGSWEEWERASRAALNVVATTSGLALAREMERVWGTPFVFADELACGHGAPAAPTAGLARAGQRILVVGEQVQANLLRRALLGKTSSDSAGSAGADSTDAVHDAADVRVAWFFGMERGRMQAGDVRLAGEGDLAALAREGRFDAVLADPALGVCLPEGMPLFPFRNLAVANGPASGTTRADELRDLAARGDATPWREAQAAWPEPTPWTAAWFAAIGEFLQG